METYRGCVRTPADAIKLFEACRIGLLPRVQRRLSEKERQSIRSGSVFVWDEREAGMRRWTDGKSWSASRVSGSFLTYREMEGKRGGGFSTGRRGAGKTPDSSGRGSDEDQDDDGPDGYRYKADGLMKQSFSITTSAGQHLHLISYFSRPHPGDPELLQPSNDAQLRHIIPIKGMYPESSINESPGPALTKTPMQYSPHAQSHGNPNLSYHPYSQSGYTLPPSPLPTPPYSHHYTVTSSGLPPPAVSAWHAPPLQQAYGSAGQYDRNTLPPVGPAAQPRTSPYGQSQHMGHASLPRPASPAGHHFHHSGHVSASGPRHGIHAGPLPAPRIAGNSTPPPRPSSTSPPRSSHSDAGTTLANGSSGKASLSALLHPTKPSSDAGINGIASTSAGSSPRLTASGTAGPVKPSFGEDARAISVLDKRFHI